MDEGLVLARHQPVGVAGRHLDEVAEHVVVADLEAIDAGLAGVSGLQVGNVAPAFVAQHQKLVQRLVVALGDEAAFTSERRKLRLQGAFQMIDQDLVQAEIALAPGQALGQALGQVAQTGIVQGRAQRRCGRQTLGDGRQIAGSAVAQREPVQRPPDIGTAAQDLAHAFAQALVVGEALDHVET